MSEDRLLAQQALDERDVLNDRLERIGLLFETLSNAFDAKVTECRKLRAMVNSMTEDVAKLQSEIKERDDRIEKLNIRAQEYEMTPEKQAEVAKKVNRLKSVPQEA
jgi:predicted RNase H-like nuclease (RuvC/YqgF family)